MAAISSPGIGSNLDVTGLVSKLMSVESQPLTALQQREATYQAKLTAYSTIQSSLTSFQNSLSSLSSPSLFQAISATSSNTSVLSATADSTAATGSYAVNVTQVAQAQSISSAGQTSTSASIGAGTSTTLTFKFGTISGGTLTNGTYSGATFTQDTTQAAGTVVIDSTNNSLQGIRDAINAAKIGVTASIVNNGDPNTPYHLLLTSNNPGAARSMQISVGAGDASVASLMSYNPAGTQNFTQTTTAQNASLSVNGLAVTSATNSVTGAIPGVTLNLTGQGSTTLSLSNNTSAVASAVQSFVTAYNNANTTIATLTGYNSTTKKGGILLGDSSAQMLQTQMRGVLDSVLNGLGGNSLTNLTQVGISFQKDGSLSVDSGKLQAALASNFSNFAGLFATNGTTTDSLVSFAGSGNNSKAGSYAVNVTSLATQGKAVGSDAATQALMTGSTAANLTITGGANDKLQVAVDGGSPIAVTLTAGTYADANALAAQVQTDINNALSAASQSGTVSVSQNGGVLAISSNKFGTASALSIVNDPGSPGNTGATDLLGGAPTSSAVTTIKTGVNDTLTLGVSGTTATITLAAGTYTASALAAQIQSAFNTTAAFSSSGISVGITQSAGVLTVTSNKYGSSSAVSIAGGTAATDLFGAAPTATLGTNIAGTINSVTAVGLGQYLTGATGDASEGIRVQVTGGATGARGTINFSQGYAYNMSNLLNNFLGATGSIANSINSTNSSIADLQSQEREETTRLTAIQARYQAQFTALDTLISSMSSTSSYLTQQLANLPKANSSSSSSN